MEENVMDQGRILVTGAKGYIGSNVASYLSSRGYDVYGLDLTDAEENKYYRGDIVDSQSIRDIIRLLQPGIIVHAAALSNLDECEKNRELATKTNVEGTRNIIDGIRDCTDRAKLVFMSTDYVFDGHRGNYKEDDTHQPSSYYGKTKVMSEDGIKDNLENYIICRTASVFGRGGNFFNFVANSLRAERTIEIYDDVFYTPTYIDYLTACLAELIEIDYKGIIHVVGRERMSRYEFALKLARALGKNETLIRPAKYNGTLISKDSSLNSDRARAILKSVCPSIQRSLHYCFGDLRPPYFRFSDQRGQFLGILQGGQWEEVNYIESAMGAVRGNHYHKETRESFFIIDGRIRVTLLNITDQSRRTFTVEKGDIVSVDTNTVHTFEVLEDSKWINMLSKAMRGEHKDMHRMSCDSGKTSV